MKMVMTYALVLVGTTLHAQANVYPHEVTGKTKISKHGTREAACEAAKFNSFDRAEAVCQKSSGTMGNRSTYACVEEGGMAKVSTQFMCRPMSRAAEEGAEDDTETLVRGSPKQRLRMAMWVESASVCQPSAGEKVLPKSRCVREIGTAPSPSHICCEVDGEGQ